MSNPPQPASQRSSPPSSHGATPQPIDALVIWRTWREGVSPSLTWNKSRDTLKSRGSASKPSPHQRAGRMARSHTSFGAGARHAPRAEGEATKGQKEPPASSPREGPCAGGGQRCHVPCASATRRPRRGGNSEGLAPRNLEGGCHVPCASATRRLENSQGAGYKAA